jgi:1-acyl-sn-glycerol-3-phosphate acyltransferase
MLPGLKLHRLSADDRRKELRNILLWLPINLLQAGSFVAVCLILIPLALLIHRITGNTKIPLWMAHRWWGPIVVGGGLAKLKVSGKHHWNPNKTYLVVANHQSYFDIPVLYSALPAPIHFLGVDYLQKVRRVGHFGKAVGTIYLNLRSPAHSAAAIRELCTYLRSGRSTVVFPEGTRSWDGRIGRFSSALFSAAIHAAVEIVPVAIVNSRKVMPRGGGFLFRPGTVEVRLAPPISTQNVSPKDYDALAKKIRERIELLHAS